MNSLYDISVETIEGKTISLGEFRGKVLLIVNVASECGFTPQYQGLQALHDHFGPQGFSVLGFPCNQFGGQEPGSNEEIKSFCENRFKITFPLFAKIDVNGANAHPLFVFLKSQASGILGTEAIKWNFTKFLVDRNGNVVDRFGSSTGPTAITDDIEKILGDTL